MGFLFLFFIMGVFALLTLVGAYASREFSLFFLGSDINPFRKTNKVGK